MLFIIGDWNVKVGSHEIYGVTGKFGLQVQNEAGKKLVEFCQDLTGHKKHPLPTTQDSTHGHHQIVNTKSRLQPKMEKLPTVSRNKTGS